MHRRKFLATLTATLLSPASLLAASPVATVIVVDDMHCANCARKIAGKLYAVPGVVDVKANVPANTATVVPQQQRQPSPRAMWEAVEKAGFQPLKLQGPYGTFLSKPKV